MARRNDSILDLLVTVPWWVSVLVSLGAYVFVAYVIPAMLGQHPLLGPLARELPRLAPVVAFVFLVPAPLSVLRQWRARRLLDAQTGLDSIRAMNWLRFETLVGEAYRREGYSVEETGGGGPDGGVDLVLRRDGVAVLVQCKHWRAYRVGVKEVRELLGVVTAESAAGGILVTSGSFTPDAKDFARDRPLQLVDGPRLLQLVRLVQAGQPTDSSTVCPAARTSGDPIPPACPACGRRMVLRTSKRGSTPGSRFWGCSAYPDCRGTKDLRHSASA